jgi:hypothetical protein
MAMKFRDGKTYDCSQWLFGVDETIPPAPEYFPKVRLQLIVIVILLEEFQLLLSLFVSPSFLLTPRKRFWTVSIR